jgi:glycosyltransferase involved in cell wall biosynthesis
MNANPRVSIIVPIYNVEPFLEQCVLSLVNQTCQDIEVILVDDGSPDKCGEICDRFAAEYPIVKVIHQENQGASVARNAGMDIARGEWLAFVDGDDWVELDMVEKMLPYAEEKGCDILGGCYFRETTKSSTRKLFGCYDGRVVAEEEKLKFLSSLFHPAALGLTSNVGGMIGGPLGKLYKKSLIIDNYLRFVPGLKRGQDVIFNLYAFQCAAKIVLKDPPYYHYRASEGSLVFKHAPDFQANAKQMIKEIQAFASKYYSDKSSIIIDNLVFNVFLAEAKLRVLHRDAPYTLRQRVRKVKALAAEPVYSSAIRNANWIALNKGKKLALLLVRWRQYGLFCCAGMFFQGVRGRMAY